MSQKNSPDFQALQEWEGCAELIEDDHFVATLVDLTAGKEYPTEEAMIPLDEISESDAKAMTVGSFFHWRIGYELPRTEGKDPVSQIIFLKGELMTEADFERGREWAKKMARVLEGTEDRTGE